MTSEMKVRRGVFLERYIFHPRMLKTLRIAIRQRERIIDFYAFRGITSKEQKQMLVNWFKLRSYYQLLIADNGIDEANKLEFGRNEVLPRASKVATFLAEPSQKVSTFEVSGGG